MKRPVRTIVPYLLVALIVSTLSISVYANITGDQVDQTSRYKHLARRVQVDNPSEVKINFTGLHSELSGYVNSLGVLSPKVSVYFEYLPSGVEININEKNETIAASLMKLPTVMNLYKAHEQGLIDMDKKIALKKEWLNSDYGELYKKGEGYEISVREAARLTLKDSDNTALLLIFDQISNSGFSEAQGSLNYLDVEYDVVEDGRVQIGARSYSSIIKCLYLSCFNTLDNSEEIMQSLIESSFQDRLTKYLPTTLEVSHKIGTFDTRYQSDCGLVYLERNHYVLCVMVQGEDPEASEIIASISQKTYLYLSGK